MKKSIYCLFLVAAIVFASCRKKADVEDPIIAPTAKADDAAARTELNNAYDDIETVYNSDDYSDASGALRTSSSNARISGAVLPCGTVTIDTKNFKIDYGQSGVNCGAKVLSGSIDVTLVEGTKFSDQDAKLKVVFTNYEVQYALSKQSVTYNGIAYVTNQSGGNLLSLFTNTANAKVVHTIRGDLSITYDTLGTPAIRSWKSFRKKTFENKPGTETGITLTLEGDTTVGADTYIAGAYGNVTEIGYNVNNEKFVCNVTTPFFWQNCGTTYSGPYKLKQGLVEYTAFSSNPYLIASGYTKLKWSATAGYRFDGKASLVLDQSCGSNAYKIDAALTNPNTGKALYSSSSFILY